MQLLTLAFRNILQARRRTALAMSANAFIAFVLVALFGLLDASRETMYEVTTSLFTGQLNVVGVYKPNMYRAERLLTDADGVERKVREALPDARILRRTLSVGRVASGGGSLRHEQILMGVDIAHEEGLRRSIEVLEGSLEALAEPRTVMLFEDQAKKLQVGIGDTITVTARTVRGAQNAVSLRVVAIARPGGSMTSILLVAPHAAFNQLLGVSPNATSMLQVHFPQPLDYEALAEARRAVRTALVTSEQPLLDESPMAWSDGKKATLETQPWTGQRLDITSWRDDFAFQTDLLEGLGALATLLSVILVVVVSSGLMASLWLSIRERTREVGTLRAIGMRKRKVVLQFLLEAFLVALLGNAAGAVLAIVAGLTANALGLQAPGNLQFFLGIRSELKFLFDPASVVQTVLWLSVASTLFALVPSLQASRLKPVTAMHHAG